MSSCTGSFYTENGVLKATGQSDEEKLLKHTVLYEVIRVREKVCLFLEDHLLRLQESVNLSGLHYTIDLSRIRESLSLLITHNAIQEGNIRLLLAFPRDKQTTVHACFIPHSYPSGDQYKFGVETQLFKAIRMDPNVKRIHAGMREKVARFIQSENIYEALLVNDQGHVTEGSKSNVFFLRKGILFTPPGSQVLKGITRGKILGICNNLHIRIDERPVPVEELPALDGAFLTGTSPKVLPIRRIGVWVYPVSSPIMKRLIVAYDNLIEAYIQQHR